MTIAHHPPHELLVAQAAGASSAGEELWVAAHLTLCAACRASVERAEHLGAALLSGAEEAPLPAGSLERLLGRLDEEEPAPPVVPPGTILPAPLRALAGADAPELPWRRLGAGLRIHHVPLVSDTSRVFLLDFPAGFRIPAHGHDGVERVLVLTGGFTDRTGRFRRGDVAIRDDDDHRVRIDDDERCICLFVNDGPALLGSDWITRLADWWLG